MNVAIDSLDFSWVNDIKRDPPSVEAAHARNPRWRRLEANYNMLLLNDGAANEVDVVERPLVKLDETIRRRALARLERAEKAKLRAAPATTVGRPRARTASTRRVRALASSGSDGDPEPPRSAQTAGAGTPLTQRERSIVDALADLLVADLLRFPTRGGAQ